MSTLLWYMPTECEIHFLILSELQTTSWFRHRDDTIIVLIPHTVSDESDQMNSWSAMTRFSTPLWGYDFLYCTNDRLADGVDLVEIGGMSWLLCSRKTVFRTVDNERSPFNPRENACSVQSSMIRVNLPGNSTSKHLGDLKLKVLAHVEFPLGHPTYGEI